MRISCNVYVLYRTQLTETKSRSFDNIYSAKITKNPVVDSFDNRINILAKMNERSYGKADVNISIKINKNMNESSPKKIQPNLNMNKTSIKNKRAMTQHMHKRRKKSRIRLVSKSTNILIIVSPTNVKI